MSTVTVDFAGRWRVLVIPEGWDRFQLEGRIYRRTRRGFVCEGRAKVDAA